MAKDKITDYSATAADNTDVGGVGIQGTNAISNIDNAAREIMSHLKETSAGTFPVEDTWTFGDPADLTKRVRLDAGGVTAGQTRVLTAPNFDGTIATLAGTETLTNKTLTSPTIAGSIALTGIISPAQITADQNNYAPTGHATATVWRLTSDATRTITGIAGGVDGRVIHLVNVGNFSIDLAYDSASSTAANRIYTIGGETMRLWGFWTSVTLRYDGTLSRWMVIAAGNSTYAADATQMEAATSQWQFVVPSEQHRHPGHPKCWGRTTGGATPSLAVSYNVTSITDTAVGRLTVTIGTDFSGTAYAAAASAFVGTNDNRMCSLTASLAGSIIIETSSAVTTLADPATGLGWVFLGDQ